MNSNIYNIDYQKLNVAQTPTVLRQRVLLAWIKLLAVPFVFIYQDLLRYRKAVIYDLMITPQVCYLEMMLNDRYDFSGRRIYIADSVEYPPVYLYMRDELKPVYLYRREELKPVYLYTRGEGKVMADDFIVMVPDDIVFKFVTS